MRKAFKEFAHLKVKRIRKPEDSFLKLDRTFFSRNYSLYFNFRVDSLKMFQKSQYMSFSSSKKTISNENFLQDLEKELTSEEIQVNENTNQETLREIQQNPKYEAAIGQTINGDFDKSISLLKELAEELKEKRKFNEDYIFLLQKMVSINKIRKKPKENIPIIDELDGLFKKFYQSDFTKLFESIEYNIIHLTEIDPAETIDYINEVIEEQIFPQFFNHIFFYYLSTAYVLEGRNLDKATTLFDEIIKVIDDDFLKSCILNNFACASWWSTMNNAGKESMPDRSFMEKLALDIYSVLVKFKTAVALLEGIKIEETTGKTSYPGLQEKEEENRINVLKYALSKDFEEKIDLSFVKDLSSFKQSFTENKTTAIILSNLGELYHNMKDHKRALIYLNLANLYYENKDAKDPLIYKNHALIYMCNWQIYQKADEVKKAMEKILGYMKNYPDCYEKVFIMRLYGEFLSLQKDGVILGNEYINKANKLENSIPYFDCRRPYLIIPGE